jgi:DNA-dependent protein kinase catalytic subunit
LVNYASGEIVAIDFGCSFGAGINIYVPEMMPFRLTRVLREVMQPVGEHGPFAQAMLHALLAFRAK